MLMDHNWSNSFTKVNEKINNIGKRDEVKDFVAIIVALASLSYSSSADFSCY